MLQKLYKTLFHFIYIIVKILNDHAAPYRAFDTLHYTILYVLNINLIYLQ